MTNVKSCLAVGHSANNRLTLELNRCFKNNWFNPSLHSLFAVSLHIPEFILT